MFTIITVQAYVVYDTDCPIRWAHLCIEYIIDLLSNYLCDYKVMIGY